VKFSCRTFWDHQTPLHLLALGVKKRNFSRRLQASILSQRPMNGNRCSENCEHPLGVRHKGSDVVASENYPSVKRSQAQTIRKMSRP